MCDLYTVYEPIVDLKKEQVYGYEALLQGPRPPEELFIEAERRNQIHELDHLSHRIALESIRLPKEQKIFLNCHPYTLLSEPILSLPASIEANQIVIEITEHREIHPQMLRNACHYFKKIGVKVALDDFGVGHNHLHTLDVIQPDYLKIDRNIIQSHSKESKGFIQYLVEWGREHQVDIIAEGIENEQHLLHCLKMGIQKGQGWLLGIPQRMKSNDDLASIHQAKDRDWLS